MINSNIPRRPTVLAAVGLAVALVLSFALNPTPAFAGKPDAMGNHDHGGDDGSGGRGTGGRTEIALCATLATAGELDALGGITAVTEDDSRFCDDAGGMDVALLDGVFGFALGAVAVPRVQLDFGGCVDEDEDLDANSTPDCEQRDLDEIVVGDPGTGLAGVAFGTGNTVEALDFAAEEFKADETRFTELEVVFGLSNGSPQKTRTINYGTRLAPVNEGGCGPGSSDKVMVTRLEGTEADGTTATDDCWVVESMPLEEACLILDSGKGNNLETLLQGRYHMPFIIRLARFGDSFTQEGVPEGLVTCPWDEDP